MELLQIHDQTGRSISVPAMPQRIISLVPSQTELLFDLGLENRIAGVTKFCVHPLYGCRAKEKVGGTKKLHVDKIKKLDPDIILASKEENSKEDIEFLARRYPVWISDIVSLDDAYEMIASIGYLTGTVKKSDEIIEDIKLAFKKIVRLPPYKVVYLIWKKPYMAAGKGTFINSLIKCTGLTNAIEEERYPEVSDLHSLKADLIMLSSEPFPFKDKHIDEIKQLLPDTPVMLVDGEMFSWYGSRLKFFPSYFNSMATELRSSQK